MSIDKKELQKDFQDLLFKHFSRSKNTLMDSNIFVEVLLIELSATLKTMRVAINQVLQSEGINK